jgi:hypothetical protein
MLINYKCPHCPYEHDLNSWETGDILFYLRNLVNNRVSALPPFNKLEWISILKTELLRRQRTV